MSCNAVAILSLKGALLSYLERFLFGGYEAEETIFTEFLHNREIQASFSPAARTNSPLIRQIDWQKIPVQKRQTGSSVLYISTLPQILTKKRDAADLSTLSKISQRLVSRLNQVQFDPSNSELDHNFDHLEFLTQLWPQFQIEIQRPGRIAFYLSDSGVLLWLQQVSASSSRQQRKSNFAQPLSKQLNRPDQTLAEQTLPSDVTANRLLLDSPLLDRSLLNGALLNCLQSISLTAAQRLGIAAIETDALLWQMQYLHARCCTLLRLWQAILPPDPPAMASLAMASLAMDHSQWLQSSETRQLLQALIAIADHVFWIPYEWELQQYILLYKLITQLYQSFDQFYGVCLSGFGQISLATPVRDRQLFQARFNLVEATKNVLKALLCAHLGINAQTSL
jgi:hypothetical protein